MTMTHIETVTVGSGGAASIEFSAISGDFTDLLLIGSVRTNRASVVDSINFTFNSTGGSTRFLYGTGSSAASATEAKPLITYVAGNNATANTFGSFTMYVPNYGSSANKSVSIDAIGENNATAAYQGIGAAIVNYASPVTTMTFEPEDGTAFQEHTRFSLYGITAGSDGIVTVS